MNAEAQKDDLGDAADVSAMQDEFERLAAEDDGAGADAGADGDDTGADGDDSGAGADDAGDEGAAGSGGTDEGAGDDDGTANDAGTGAAAGKAAGADGKEAGAGDDAGTANDGGSGAAAAADPLLPDLKFVFDGEGFLASMKGRKVKVGDQEHDVGELIEQVPEYSALFGLQIEHALSQVVAPLYEALKKHLPEINSRASIGAQAHEQAAAEEATTALEAEVEALGIEGFGELNRSRAFADWYRKAAEDDPGVRARIESGRAKLIAAVARQYIEESGRGGQAAQPGNRKAALAATLRRSAVTVRPRGTFNPRSEDENAALFDDAMEAEA